MVVVVLAAIALWGLRLASISRNYAALSQLHAAQAKVYSAGIALVKVEASASPADVEAQLITIARIRDYHAALARKYADASRYPWKTPEPDPAPPR